MNTNLLFDFSVDKERKTITVKREFDANLYLVWDAWTKPELLDQWWAPKPYQTKTKSMDFREGGIWLYAMIGPANETHWCRADYKKIEPLKRFSALDAFCDENGKINTDFPRSSWTNAFRENDDITTVNITIQYDDLADLEKIIEMGFKEGFTMGLENLDELLSTIKNTTAADATKITVETTISAPAKKVWDFWTKPEHITKWNFASDDWHCPKAENDLKAGGKLRSRMEAKDGSMGFDFEAVYDEVVDQKKISYTMADGRQATTDFESLGNQTKVTTSFDAEKQHSTEMQRSGWQAILENFKKYVEMN